MAKLSSSIFGTACLLLSLACGANASIVYNFADNPGEQDGHTLSGTITTVDAAPNDGMLAASEIVDWNITVTGPIGFDLAQSTTTRVRLSGVIELSPTELVIRNPIMGVNGIGFGDTTSRATLRYFRVVELSGAGVFGDYSARDSAGTEAWNMTDPLFGGTSTSSPWTVATAAQNPTAVPEPASLLMWLGILATACVLMRLRRDVQMAVCRNAWRSIR